MFASYEPQSQLTALLLAIILLMYTRQYKVRGIVKMKRSQSCRDGARPPAGFIREKLRLFYLTGVTSYAVFPSRYERAAKLTRLVLSLSSYLLPMSFVKFLSEDEFESWLRAKNANRELYDLQEFDLLSKHSDHPEYFGSQFDTLRKKWPEDANERARLLGTAHGSRSIEYLSSRKSTSVCMRETYVDGTSRASFDKDATVPKNVYEHAQLGLDSLQHASKRRRRNTLARKIRLDSIDEKDKE